MLWGRCSVPLRLPDPIAVSRPNAEFLRLLEKLNALARKAERE